VLGRLADAALPGTSTPWRVGKTTSTKVIPEGSSNTCRGSWPSPAWWRLAASVFHTTQARKHTRGLAREALSEEAGNNSYAELTEYGGSPRPNQGGIVR
jgi:hypothetical protein